MSELMIKELENTQRLAQNTLNLVADSSYQGNAAKAVYEIQIWLDSISNGCAQQIDFLKAQAVDKQGTAKLVDAEVVS